MWGAKDCQLQLAHGAVNVGYNVVNNGDGLDYCCNRIGVYDLISSTCSLKVCGGTTTSNNYIFDGSFCFTNCVTGSTSGTAFNTPYTGTFTLFDPTTQFPYRVRLYLFVLNLTIYC